MPKSRAKKSSTKGFTKNSTFPPKLLNGSALSKLDNTSQTQPSSSSSSSSLVVANLLNDNDDVSFVDFITKDKENTTATNFNKQNVSYLSSLVKEQLKIECRKRGLKTKGNRLELLQRLGVKSKKGNQNQTDQQFLGNNLAKMELTKRKEKKPATTTATKSNNTSRKNLAKLRAERDNLVIWRSPVKTLNYCSKEILTLVQIYGKKVLRQRAILSLTLVLVVILGIFYHIPGRHQVLIEVIKRHTWFFTYWVGLGVLSSVGLGTGLHTFLLYLGPHIASVTLAAYECNSLNFPKPPYPDDIICPDVPDTRFPPNLWNIMTKVRLEAFLWGAGTALGELPPYFMAKAARLSGTIYDEEDIFDDKEKSNSSGDESSSIMEKGKVFMEKVVEKIGFFGILACASIPNPLFDLAGITCGHFLIPFWTFFGATLIGKAIIKMHIQKIFIIIAFNEALIEKAVDYLIFVPVVGKNLQQPFKLFLENQKQRLHNRKNAKSSEAAAGNIISRIFEIFVIGMVLYFIISIVNSFAQSYHKRLYQEKEKKGLQNNHQQPQHNSKTKAN